MNSVCGCAAANARPGVFYSLQNEKTLDHLVTVFAGVDAEATKSARDMMVPFPPSSPSIALFKDGELVHMVERHHIEGRPADLIAENLKAAYQDHCLPSKRSQIKAQKNYLPIHLVFCITSALEALSFFTAYNGWLGFFTV